MCSCTALLVVGRHGDLHLGLLVLVLLVLVLLVLGLVFLELVLNDHDLAIVDGLGGVGCSTQETANAKAVWALTGGKVGKPLVSRNGRAKVDCSLGTGEAAARRFDISVCAFARRKKECNFEF